jgi:hypothetical protein
MNPKDIAQFLKAWVKMLHRERPGSSPPNCTEVLQKAVRPLTMLFGSLQIAINKLLTVLQIHLCPLYQIFLPTLYLLTSSRKLQCQVFV